MCLRLLRPFPVRGLRASSCLCLQLVIIGKIAAGILLATAAYRPPEEFRKLTGLDQAQLLRDVPSDTTVGSKAISV